jgi:hypothetical protein
MEGQGSQRFVVQVGGPVGPADLELLPDPSEQVRLTTVLLVQLSATTACLALARNLRALGLRFDFSGRLSDRSYGRRVPAVLPGAANTYELTTAGAIRAEVLSSLAEHAKVLHQSTRYSFADAVSMGLVLSRLLERGAEIEHALKHGNSSRAAGPRWSSTGRTVLVREREST